MKKFLTGRGGAVVIALLLIGVMLAAVWLAPRKESRPAATSNPPAQVTIVAPFGGGPIVTQLPFGSYFEPDGQGGGRWVVPYSTPTPTPEGWLPATITPGPP